MSERYCSEMPVVAACFISPEHSSEEMIKFPKPLKYDESEYETAGYDQEAAKDFYRHLYSDVNRKLASHGKQAVKLCNYGITDREKMAQMTDLCLMSFLEEWNFELSKEDTLRAAAEMAVMVAMGVEA